MDIVQRNMVSQDGNNTEKWPLEVLFNLHVCASPGVLVDDFSIGLSIGFGTSMAAFLFCLSAIELEWVTKKPEAFALVAPRLLKCLRMSATYEPAASLQDQIFKSLGGKIQAAARQRPSTLMMLFSFTRAVNEVCAGGTRKNRTAILLELTATTTRGRRSACAGSTPTRLPP
jgi:hypothetical protein